MRFVKCAFAVICSLPFAVLAGEDGKPIEVKGIPWRPGNYYHVVSTYEMQLEGISLKVDEVKGGEKTWFNNPDKVKRTERTKNFNGKYICDLNYDTFGVQYKENSKSEGSALRRYNNSNIAFVPDKNSVMFEVERGFFRKLFNMEPEKFEMKDVKKNFQDADFMFREVFELGTNKIDQVSTYLMSWKEGKAQFMNRKKKITILKSNDRITELSSQARADAQNNLWESPSPEDLAYTVIQSEAKMMAYAIYGQDDVRKLGSVWSIDADILTSFLPVIQKNRQPFQFEGGKMVLKVTKQDANGVQLIEMIPEGIIGNSKVQTDLKITPNVENGGDFGARFTKPDLNSKENYVQFVVDTHNKICLEGNCNLVLRGYSGKIPNLGDKKFHIEGKEVDGEKIRANIESGTIIIAANITTEVLGDSTNKK